MRSHSRLYDWRVCWKLRRCKLNPDRCAKIPSEGRSLPVPFLSNDRLGASYGQVWLTKIMNSRCLKLNFADQSPAKLPVFPGASHLLKQQDCCNSILAQFVYPTNLNPWNIFHFFLKIYQLPPYYSIRPLGIFRVAGHDTPSLLIKLQLKKRRLDFCPKPTNNNSHRHPPTHLNCEVST